MISQSELKATYDKQGYVICEDLLSNEIISDVRSTIDKLVTAANGMEKSNDTYEIIEETESSLPRLERINSPHKVDPVFDQLIRKVEIMDILRLLLGEDIRMQDSKLNLKSGGGSSAVEWHQDWAFYPHTNDDILAVGIMIDDMTARNGPVMFVPGSHKGQIFDHCSDGFFCGAVKPDIAAEQSKHAKVVTGKAGSVTFHHCRLLHASKMNRSSDGRRFLLYEVMSADAWPLAGCHALYDGIEGMNNRIISGEQTMFPRLREAPVRLPHPMLPNATSIYMLQRHGDHQIYSD